METDKVTHDANLGFMELSNAMKNTERSLHCGEKLGERRDGGSGRPNHFERNPYYNWLFTRALS